MREFKFRAWLKVHKAIITQGDYYDFSMICNGDGFGIVSHQDENRWLKKDEFEIMQYTGLKDINGKEIYEGDIIKNGGQNYEVIFGKKTLGFGYHFNYKTSWNVKIKFYRLHSKLEVVGNVYETPELLE